MLNRLKSLEPAVSSSLLAETRGLSCPLRSADLGLAIDRLKDAFGEALLHGTRV